MVLTEKQQVVTTIEAAKLLGMTRRSVYRWLERGWLEGTVLPNGTIRVTVDSIKKASTGTRLNASL
jgi:excisionase family DNA binding protein